MANTTYDHLDQNALIFLVQYIFTKLKNSSLNKDTTYTLSKNSNGEFELKDGSGTVISTVDYDEVSSSANGLMTPALLTKLNGIAAGAQVNKIETIIVNGTTLKITDKGVSFSFPTTADVKKQIEAYGYQTASQVQSTVNTAVANVGHLTRSIVSTLPAIASAKDNVIYMVKGGETSSNVYDEYMFVDGAFEKIGDTAPNLTGYVKSSDLSAYTNEQVTSIVDTAYTAVFG